MRAERLTSRSEIETYLRRDAFLHLYEIGDLDDFFWPHTTWYGLRDGNLLTAVALLYTGSDLPVLLALDRDPGPMASLLTALAPDLPPRFYSHLSGDLASRLTPGRRVDARGTHLKMALTDPARARATDGSTAGQLTARDRDALEALYEASYPGHWFDPRMLETGYYFGIRERGELVSVAGVHVYSARYRVAALGNITTRPDRRGRGLATGTTARLVQALLASTDLIGLNVKADHATAIGCYERLGFAPVARYEEALFSG